MPTEKRTRKRAARDAKNAALQRQRKRRATVRRTITLVVIVGIAVGIYALASGGKSTPKAKLTATQIAQQTANTAAVAAGCPSDPTKALSKPKWSKAPAMTIDTSKTYTATVKTDVGTFVIALDAAHTPVSVNNFVFLTDHDFYNCVIFHRVIPTFMDQTGDPTGTGTGTPGYQFTDGVPKTASPQYPIGSVAMANDATPSSNGSQFFIVTGSEGENLQNNYTLFGQVTSGMSVVDKINADGNAGASANGVPPKVIHRMLKVTISST